MSCHHRTRCTHCGDALIHQSNRGPHESSSALGQYVHDELRRDFYWMDVDGVSYKRSTGRLTVVEHKHPGAATSPGQRVILPILAHAVAAVEASGVVSRGRVVQINGSPPFDRTSTVTVYRPDGTEHVADVDRATVDRILSGRPMSDVAA